jgi:hypothetical protein
VFAGAPHLILVNRDPNAQSAGTESQAEAFELFWPKDLCAIEIEKLQ